MNLINILAYNPQLFDGIMLPAALSQEDVVNEILQECATMEPLYGDPDLFHQMILHWFKTRNYTFQRLYDTMYLEYNPLENSYRTETRETDYGREYSRKSSEDSTENEETSSSGNSENSRDTGSTQKTTSETTATSKDQVAPYNDDSFHDTTQTTGNNTANGSVENSGNESENGSFDNSGTRETSRKNSGNLDDTENAKTTDNFTLKGSIGLITPQQMIEQERNVVKFNLYEYIAMEFSKRFMIQIY